MALFVYPFRREGEWRLPRRLDARPRAPRDELFGTDGSRAGLWASPILAELGLTLLPQLARADLLIEGTALDALEAECRLLMGEARRVGEATQSRHDHLVRRLENALEALRLAREAGEAGVFIGDEVGAAARGPS